MPKHSAGILLYRNSNDRLEVLLIHPGGPYWRNRDQGAWMIPKGQIEEGEETLEAALREFQEETSFTLSEKQTFIPLGPARLSSGKKVYAFACEGNVDASQAKSIEFEMEWPPKSGKMQSFPEVDKAAWFNMDEAYQKILKSLSGLLDELVETVKGLSH